MIATEALNYFYSKDDLKPLYDTQVRHYTIYNHTRLVCSEFEKYFSGVNMAISQGLFAAFLALHDIGKPIAYKNGDKSKQHQYTVEIIKKQVLDWGTYCFNEIDKQILVLMASSDCIGEYFQNLISADEAAAEIKRLANNSILSIEQFFYLFMVYYQCDVASYTKDAGGLYFLEKMFSYNAGKKVFDSKECLLLFSPKYQTMYYQLKSKLIMDTNNQNENLTFIKGNIFNSKAQTIVNTVNCVGVMGKGIALVFKLRYPKLFEQYKKYCDEKLINIGVLWIYKGEKDQPWVLCFPTKNHWKYPSKMEYLEAGLEKFVATYKEKGITSIAFPLLGTTNGGLDKEEVKALMTRYLSRCDIPIEIYEYDAAAKDDLFDLFKQKWNSIENKKAVIEGIRQDQIDSLDIAVNEGKVQSMISLIDTEGVGMKTLEKCFRFVMDYDSNNPAKNASEPTLFD